MKNMTLYGILNGKKTTKYIIGITGEIYID